MIGLTSLNTGSYLAVNHIQKFCQTLPTPLVTKSNNIFASYLPTVPSFPPEGCRTASNPELRERLLPHAFSMPKNPEA